MKQNTLLPDKANCLAASTEFVVVVVVADIAGTAEGTVGKISAEVEFALPK